MPRRNITIILLALSISWLCYQRASRNRYAQSLAEAMNIVSTSYISEVEPRVLFEGAMDGMVGIRTRVQSLLWFMAIGMALAVVYFVFAYRMFFRTTGQPELGTE